MKRTQRGFSAVEALLLVIIIGILVGVGWYVWHSQKQVDKTYSQTANSSAAPKIKSKASSTSESSTTLDNIQYDPPVVISSSSDSAKLTNTTKAFKDFVAGQLTIIASSENANACTKPAITVSKIVKGKFSQGDVNACNSYSLLWVLSGSAWQKVDEQDRGFSCTIINQYSIPNTLVAKCLDAQNQSVNNTVN
jgi:type II secretory pathway pseudopilin PulG